MGPGILLLAASAIALLFACLCLRDGKLPNRGWTIERRTHPVFYWMGILLYLVFAVGLFSVGVSLLSSAS
jgi:hypothetical protein